MNFAIESVSKCSGRLGKLNIKNAFSNVTLPTPALVLHSKGGSVPFLSKEVLQYLTSDPPPMLHSLTNTDHMEEAIRACGEGISSFVGQKDSISLLVLKDPAELCKPSFHEKDFVPIFSRSGRKNFTSERYMQLVEAFKPDVFVPLFDGDTDPESSKKRLQKSLDRTEKFVEQCIEAHRKSTNLKQSSLLGPIVGGYNLKLRKESVKFLEPFKDDLGGYVIAGLHSNGSSAGDLKESNLLEVVSHACQLLPADKARFMFGAFSPGIVLKLVSNGIDVLDTSYAYLKTQQNRALTFSFDVHEKDVESRETELDVRDPKWTEDFNGFIESCSCLACTKHTKAYAHHLYNTREMLGPIILMIHNLHHYLEFFKAIRKHVKEDTLSLLIEHLQKQKDAPLFEETSTDKAKSDLMDSGDNVTKKLKV
ncbi:queuine tRNA-ribosyltransferase accessory subunit 2 [Aedes albopictus]|uniref:Queuine tRNA-ribosyltransferase accessory subunit 2 n=1 Tax=Aedes albopictus TaxID=7160 RepID=A0ABM1ZKG9_AEDAL|nr:queuine tRNA-ribosyltransferase accessory subunit 2-like [Aedes albopictus]